MSSSIPAPFSSAFASDIYSQRYQWVGETWTKDKTGTPERVVRPVMAALGMENSPQADRLVELFADRVIMPGGRYLANAGSDFHQVQNCMLLRGEDTREEWGDLKRDGMLALTTGAGIGTEYSRIRPAGYPLKRTGGVASGPIPLMVSVNEDGRAAVSGGNRRCAIWAGLAWWHADVFEFIKIKDWDDAYEVEVPVDGKLTKVAVTIKDLKEADFTYAAPMDMTNISVTLDRAFFEIYEGNEAAGLELLAEYAPDWLLVDGKVPSVAPDGSSWQAWAQRVYDQVVQRMVTTAEPGFSVNYDNPLESLRNACTEITSEDDSDVCNLGSVNLGRIESLEQMREATELATLFLIAGTVYSDLPYDKVHEIRTRNRRLGLGLMGVHEFLLKRGEKYGPSETLAEYLDIYKEVSDEAADTWAYYHGLSSPLKKRAIAPNGTIGILAETTTSAEPIFAAAYKRRVYTAGVTELGDTVSYQYVVDPVAARLVADGVDPALIEDAYSLSYDVERRVEFQHWLQQWVDHGISSTVNLPYVMSDPDEQKDFGQMLYKYLPGLRGITCYPDGSRSGQPLTSVPLDYALDKVGVTYEEHEEACVGGLCGV